MFHSATPRPTRTARAPRRTVGTVGTVGIVVATIAVALPVLAGAASPTEDVDAFYDRVPGWVNNSDAECAGSDAGVAYVENRLLASGPVSVKTLRSRIHAAAYSQSGKAPGGKSWVKSVERIHFPDAPDDPARGDLYQVDLLAPPLSSEGTGHDLLELSRLVADALPSVAVSPDHGLVPAGPVTQFWPNGYPRRAGGMETPRDVPTTDAEPAGTGVKIAIYDTGLAQPRDLADLPSVQRLGGTIDTDDADPDGDGIAYSIVAGHGLAMAGVIQSVAPGAEIDVARIAAEGVATDTTTVRRIAASLVNRPIAEWPHVIVLAFGSPACLVDPTDPSAGYLVPVGLQHAIDVIDDLADSRPGGMIVVASAGNRGESRPYYPAAFGNVVGVGALDLTGDGDGSAWTTPADGAVASWSNRGRWVDAWTAGVSLKTAHLDGLKLDDGVGSPRLRGYARVDGTSYAAPLLAGLIAEQAVHDVNVDVRCAWLQLEAGAGSPQPIKPGRKPPRGAAVTLQMWDQSPLASTGLVSNPLC